MVYIPHMYYNVANNFFLENNVCRLHILICALVRTRKETEATVYSRKVWHIAQRDLVQRERDRRVPGMQTSPGK